MSLRKIISIWALLALILGQVTLAQHSVSHIDHGFFQEVTASHGGCYEHQHDKDNKNQECPECLLTKALQTAFYNAPITLSFVSEAESLGLQRQSYVISLNRSKAHSPRAPPPILI